MSSKYLIDGYNFLHAVGVLKGQTGPHGLEKARNRLLGLLDGALGDAAASAIVVFDSSETTTKSIDLQVTRRVQVRFARGDDEADDVIEELIAKHSAPKQLTIVSDDHRLQKAAKRRKAQPMSCQEFSNFLQRKRQSTQATQPEKPKIGAKEVDYWLNEFADLDNEPEMKKLFDPMDVDGPP